MNNNWHKKEKPLLGLTGLGGGVDGLAVVGAATKTYVEDVFSNTPWVGNMTDRDINTGLDMSGKGGLAWLYTRSAATGGWLFDTVRGYNKFVRSSDAY